MKKFISVLLLCSFVLLSLTACMSDKEKQQAEENEKLARTLIESYIDENFKGALITDLECVTKQGGSLFPATYASDCVKAKIWHYTDFFDVIVNLESGKIYNNRSEKQIAKEMKSLLIEKTGAETPRDIELKFISADLCSAIESDGWWYVSDNIHSAEDLLKSGEYIVLAICKYADSPMDFKSIPINSFFEKDYGGRIEVAFVNYRSDLRYDAGSLFSYEFSITSFGTDHKGFFNISEMKTASQTSSISNYSERYIHYESKTLNDTEFIWNDEYYDIKFAETSTEPEVVTKTTVGTEEMTFYPKSDKAVKFKYKKLKDDETEHIPMDFSKLYIYRKYKEAGEYMIANDSDYVYAREMKEEYKYIYAEEDMYDDDKEVIVGFYEPKQETTK